MSSKNNDWPEEEVLRAILKLDGVSGQTVADIEDYLDDPRLLHEMHAREVDAILTAEDCAKANGEEFDPDNFPLPLEAHGLRRRLCAAVNSHWAQLCDAGAV